MVRLLALSLVLLGAAGFQPARPFSPVSAAEFPPNDQLFSLASRSKLVQLASDAARREPDAPETVRLLARAEDFDRMLEVMRRIVDTAPQRIADAFVAAGDALWRFRGDDEQTRRRRETLRQIVIDARQRLPELSPEEAARAERLFITADQEFSRDRNNWIFTLQQFVERYATSEAALLTRVEILSDGRATEAQFQALEAFARQHAGTTAAARAIYEIGFDLHTINTLGTIEQRGSDPIHRFERVMAIARELESGRYPKSEWVDKAPSLVFQFFIPRDATFAPESVDRMIAMLTDYAKSHLDLREDHPASNSVIYTLTTTLADLFEKKGERTAGVERVLMNIEKTAAEPDALRYLRGLLFVQERYRQRGVDVVALMRKALDVLTPLAEEGTGLYNRKALATIGMLHLGEGDCANALKALRRYASSYRDSDWRWIALLRAGQCEESLSDFKAAADTYIQIANEHGELSVARLLATEYAARAFEALGELARALALHRQALDGWERTMYPHLSAPIPRRPTNEIPDLTRRDPSTIQKDALSARIAEIEHTLAMPGGAELERGRWLLASGRYDDAISEMRSLTQKHASSSAAAHARELSHRAQLMKGLQLANLERPGNDRAAAKTALDALGREPLDFSVVASRIARASLLWVDGDGGAAEGVMRDALDAWHAQQRPSTPAPGIEQELAAIRRAVFLPGGGGVYGNGRWDPPWPTPPPPFCLVNTDVPVKDHDGKVMRVSLVLDFDGAQRVVFFNTDQIAVLRDILVQLGGTRRREPGHIMETPNQPVGDSMQILKLWSKFFVARPGHWGGWDLETAPVITEIEFTNAERTKASARVTIGYTGGTVELEKEDGRWIAKRLTNQWIT
jgi:tetratricopeptide (TPR) repeat protein